MVKTTPSQMRPHDWDIVLNGYDIFDKFTLAQIQEKAKTLGYSISAVQSIVAEIERRNPGYRVKTATKGGSRLVRQSGDASAQSSENALKRKLERFAVIMETMKNKEKEMESLRADMESLRAEKDKLWEEVQEMGR